MEMTMNVSERIDALSEQLQARRKVLGLTQAELASLAEVSPRFIFDLENGKETLSLNRVLRVCSVVGLTLEWKLSTSE